MKMTGQIFRIPRRDRRDWQKGSILVLVSAVLAVLLAFMGLAFDASYTYFYKRRMQTAADAGAIAGAQELLRDNASAVTTAARKDTGLNRFTHGVSGIDVAVNNPPSSGARAGNTNFVEVIITQAQPTWFLRILGVDSATVKARAVAGLSDSEGCIYALNRDASQQNNGFFANGTTEMSFSCAIFSNANFRTVGGACIAAPSVSYSGTYSNTNGSDANCGPEDVGYGIPVVDPVEDRFTLPATAPCDYNNYKETSGTALTLTPGVYCGGIEIGGSVPTATFMPGTYVLVGGGLKLSSGVNASGAGVTFFNTFPTNENQYAPIVINTSGTVTFTAPTAGANKALLFWQDPRVAWRANNGSVITAGSTSSFQGILYFPSTDLTYAGNSSSGSSGYTLLVGYNVKIAGTAQINTDFSSLGGTSPLAMAAFVE